MPCYHPLKGFTPLSKDNGGRLVFNTRYALNPHNPITIPCNVCTGCRIDRSRDVAARAMHEAQMHRQNSFITLTFDNAFLPEDYSVQKRTFQLFMKKLRKQLPQKIRFLGVGEYGDEELRPHYHALIFGHDWDDKILWKKNPQGDPLFVSEKLTAIWGFGHCTTGEVNYTTAGYCSRYTMKKITGDRALSHYLRTHPLSKQVVKCEPEFSLSSRRPGLGGTWFAKYHTDVFPSDFIVVNGKEHSVPRYYTKKLEEKALEKIKRKRKKSMLGQKANNTPARLRVREQVKLAAMSTLKRTLK
ncbi:replication initiator protein [Blackfly microvirus SF02]|uniref:Replication initiator protein n=1 Tax=Blackfly microvirus SF02 TaxID=2576452 RepID=A0A4P8PK81_9VIRU|nr:replication initiator protein [Blackfly microvirus SF02]